MNSDTIPRNPPTSESRRLEPQFAGDGGFAGDRNGRGGGGGGGGDDANRWQPPLSNSMFAMFGVLIFSAMYFSGLIGALLVLRESATQWPPAGSPPLPDLLYLSTGLILASSVTLSVAHLLARRQRVLASRRWLITTSVLGCGFLLAQGLAWSQMFSAGFLPRTNNFGGSFYLISWSHGLHALAGTAWLVVFTVLSRSFPLIRLRHGIALLSLFWHFVDLLWIALFVLLLS